MRVAVVVMPFGETDLPPVHVARMVGGIKQLGHTADVFDFNIRLWKQLRGSLEYREFWEPSFRILCADHNIAQRFWEETGAHWNRFIAEIVRSAPDMVSFWVTAWSYPLTLLFVRALKRAQTQLPVTLVGPHLFLSALEEDQRWHLEQFMVKSRVDALCHGPLCQDDFSILMAKAQYDGELQSGPGIHVRKGDRVYFGSTPNVIRNMDILPFADYMEFPLNAYDEKTALPHVVSFYCLCSFCRSTFLKNINVAVSGTRLFQEALYQRRFFPKRRKIMYRDIIRPQHTAALRQFGRLMGDHGRSDEVRWEIFVEFPGAFSSDDVETFSKSGCEKITYVLRGKRETSSLPVRAEAGAPPIRTVGKIYLSPETTDVRGELDFARGLSGYFDEMAVSPVDPSEADYACLHRPSGHEAMTEPAFKPSSNSEKRDHKSLKNVIRQTSWETRLEIADFARKVFHWTRFDGKPLRALKACLEACENWGDQHPVMKRVTSVFEKDMHRLYSAAIRLEAAEEVFRKLPESARKDVWFGSPTFENAVDAGTCRRHRETMKISPDHLMQVAERWLLAALARTFGPRLFSARLCFDASENALSILWGRETLRVADVYRLVTQFGKIRPQGAEWEVRNSVRRLILTGRPFQLLDAALRASVRGGENPYWVSVLLLRRRNELKILASTAARLRAADRILKTLPPQSGSKIWQDSPTFDHPEDSGAWHRHRRAMKVFRNMAVQRVERFWLTAMSKLVRVRGAQFYFNEKDDRIEIGWNNDRLDSENVLRLHEKLEDRLRLSKVLSAPRKSAEPNLVEA